MTEQTEKQTSLNPKFTCPSKYQEITELMYHSSTASGEKKLSQIQDLYTWHKTRDKWILWVSGWFLFVLHWPSIELLPEYWHLTQKKQEILQMRGQKFHFSGNSNSLLGHNLVNIPISEGKKHLLQFGGGEGRIKKLFGNVFEW